MHRDLVEQRTPGPLAAQLAIYLGYVHYRITGATLVGIAFVLPSFLMVVALGAAYVAPAPRKRYNVQRTGNDVRLMSNASEAFFGKMSPAQSKVDK